MRVWKKNLATFLAAVLVATMVPAPQGAFAAAGDATGETPQAAAAPADGQGASDDEGKDQAQGQQDSDSSDQEALAPDQGGVTPGEGVQEPADEQSDAEDGEADLTAQDGAGVKMYRLYNPNSGEHFYTSDAGERDNVTAAGWYLEGIGWVAPATGDPVYRLYNPNAGDHHYTLDAGERDWLVSLGWRYEGVGWYSGGSYPLYRQYNPNAQAGAHNFTTDKGENDHLASVGWRAEGIGWYGVGQGGAAFANPALSTRTQSRGYGWTDWVGSGAQSGGTGQVEQLQVQASSSDLSGAAQVRSCNAGGWTGWSGDNGSTGGSGTRMEAFQVQLTGQMSYYYNVWYRAHIQNAGWLGWAKNGETAGSVGQGLRVEALQVMILPKNAGAPGSTDGHEYSPMSAMVAGYSSPTPYLIYVNRGACRTYVYTGSQGNWILQREIVCSPGKPSTPTISGVHHVGSKTYVFGHGYSCYYATQISGDYLFHSILYRQGTFAVMDGTLGRQVSHGCVRMALENAQYIYNTVPAGSTIVIV